MSKMDRKRQNGDCTIQPGITLLEAPSSVHSANRRNREAVQWRYKSEIEWYSRIEEDHCDDEQREVAEGKAEKELQINPATFFERFRLTPCHCEHSKKKQ